MKGYRGQDGKVRIFRPQHNMVRMNFTAERACLPTFNGSHLISCIQKLLELDQEWVPHSEASSLYIRPTMIGVDPSLGVGASSEVELFVILRSDICKRQLHVCLIVMLMFTECTCLQIPFNTNPAFGLFPPKNICTIFRAQFIV